MLLSLAAERRLLFVGGKGGVGKTSVASAVAYARAAQDASVLLVSTDPAHNLGHLWDTTVGDEPTRLTTSTTGGVVDGWEIDPEATVERHLAGVRQQMMTLLPARLHRQADRHLALAREAPGTHESAVLDRLAVSVEVGLDAYDLVVVDTAPTGHTLRLLTLPTQLTSWAETLLANRDRSDRLGAALRSVGGREESTDRDSDAALRRILLGRQRRFGALRDLIVDRSRTSFVLVLIAERLPVAESLALHAHLDELGVDVGAVVVNRRSPGDAGALLEQRRRLEEEHLAVLRAAHSTPIVELPLIAGDLVGSAGVAAIAAELGVDA